MYIHILILVRTDLDGHRTNIRHIKCKGIPILYVITQQKIHGKSTFIRDFHTISLDICNYCTSKPIFQFYLCIGSACHKFVTIVISILNSFRVIRQTCFLCHLF